MNTILHSLSVKQLRQIIKIRERMAKQSARIESILALAGEAPPLQPPAKKSRRWKSKFSKATRAEMSRKMKLHWKRWHQVSNHA